MKKAQVGLIVDDMVQAWNIHDLIQRSLSSEIYEIKCIVIQKIKPKKYKNFFLLIQDYFFKLISLFERLLVRRFLNTEGFFKKYDLNSFGINSIEVTPLISDSGFIYRYSSNDLQEIKKQNLDLLIRGGSGILKGEILNVCPEGIISFHHGDNDVNRGGPPAFWEVYQREDCTGFIIQILNEELDGGKVVFKGNIPTSFFYILNKVRLYRKANIFMHKILEDMFTNKEARTYKKLPYDKPLYKLPNLRQQIRYLSMTLFYILKKIFRKVLKKRITWNVAYQFTDSWREVSFRKSKIIKNPTNGFIADPFLFKFKNKNFCFVEQYDFKTQKGHISVYEINDLEDKYIGTVLKDNFHFSYPYIFENNEEIYMCPETSEMKDIRLYRCLDFPLKWELEKTLIKDVSAVDSNIFEFNEKWWMLTNIDSSDSGEHCSELHLFYSSDLRANWKPHPLNPIIFDSKTARNGGMILENGELFRVYQRQGWDNYGEGFGVAKITNINEHEYSEERLFEVGAGAFDKAVGTHTFNSINGLVATDFVTLSKKGN